VPDDLLVKHHEGVMWLDSDPIKVEHLRKKGLRVLYADAEDPGLWSNIQLGGVHTVMLAMPEISAKVLATIHLRKIGFSGTITFTVVFDEEVEQLKAAGADLIYDYCDGVGASFVLNTLAQIQGYNEQ